MLKVKIKKNDMVMVVKGRDRGKTGKVMRVMPEAGPRAGRAAQYREAPFQAARRRQSGRNRRKGSAAADRERDDLLRSLQRAGARGMARINADDTKSRICRRCDEALGND